MYRVAQVKNSVLYEYPTLYLKLLSVLNRCTSLSRLRPGGDETSDEREFWLTWPQSWSHTFGRGFSRVFPTISLHLCQNWKIAKPRVSAMSHMERSNLSSNLYGNTAIYNSNSTDGVYLELDHVNLWCYERSLWRAFYSSCSYETMNMFIDMPDNGTHFSINFQFIRRGEYEITH